MSDGWNPVTEKLRADLDRLEEELRQLIFTPKMRAQILSYLKAHPDSTEREVKNALNPGEVHLLWISTYYAWKELEKEKLIEWTSRGQGRPRTWRLNE